MNVCLPFIITTKSEIEKFVDDPEEFVALACDTCSEQKSKVIKTQASNLLDALCDTIDGAASFIVAFSFATIEYSLLSNNIDDIPEKFPVLNEYKNIPFLTHTDARTRVDTSLIILTTLCYVICKRPDIIEEIEALLANYKEYFLGDKSDALIKSRVCLFLGYYFEIIFQRKNQKEFVELQLEFLVNCLSLQAPEVRAISEQAVDALSTIFQQNDQRNQIGPFLPKLIERLASYIECTNNQAYFDVIEEIFTTFRKRLLTNPVFLQQILEQLVNRSKIECELIAKDKSRGHIILNRIWAIIVDIGEEPSFIPRFQHDIEKIMEPLYKFIDIEGGAPFEEDLLKYITAVTKISKEVSPFCWSVLQVFPNIFMSSGQIFGSLFKPLNQLIIYGRARFEGEGGNNLVKILLEMGCQGLNPTHKNANDADVCDAALILQLILQYLGGILPGEWENMIQSVLEKLDSQQLKPFVKAKLCEVILCAFIVDFDLTYKIVHQKNVFPQLLDICLTHAVKFEHPYDRKLLMLSLSTILAKAINDPFILDRNLQIFNILISYLKFSEYMEQLNAQGEYTEEDKENINTKDILMGFLSTESDQDFNRQAIDLQKLANYQENYEEGQQATDQEQKEDNDYDYADFKEEDPDENEMLRHLKSFETELLLKDEFQLFREALYVVRDFDQKILDRLFEWLQSNKREYLKEILQSQRVLVDKGDGRTESEARKIVKPRGRKVAQSKDIIDLVNGNQE